MGRPDYLTCPLRNLYAGQEATVRKRHGTMDWFQLGKEYVKAVYCHPAYLTYMQSTLCEIPGWMKQNLELRLLREISKYQKPQMYRCPSSLMAESEKELKRLSMRVKEESENAGLKLSIQKKRS